MGPPCVNENSLRSKPLNPKQEELDLAATLVAQADTSDSEEIVVEVTLEMEDVHMWPTNSSSKSVPESVENADIESWLFSQRKSQA